MRRRIVTAIVGVAAASVLLFALPLALALREGYRDDEQLWLQRDTVGATRQIDLGGGAADAVELPPNHDRLTVYDRAGHRVAGPGPVSADSTTRRAIATGRPADGSADGQLITSVPLLVNERVAGSVWAARSTSAITDRTQRAWLRLAALAAAVVLVAAIAAVLVARRLAAPLEDLAGSARRLGEGDFSTRAPRAGVGELDEVAAALDATAQRLDELVSRERAFSADASHQLRTPLAALRIELEALELEGHSEDVARALAQVDRLEATIATLLAITRDQPRGDSSTDLATLLADVGDEWHGRLADQARPLRLDPPANGTRARADPGVVREILGVLLDNACAHGAGAVRVAVRPEEDWVAIDVSDEGDGIADPHAAFERRAGESHGIGLALARSLAHAEGGRLTLAASGPHPRFTLTLPRLGLP